MKVLRSTLQVGDKFTFEGTEFIAVGNLGGQTSVKPPYKTINMLTDYTVEIDPIQELVELSEELGLYDVKENPLVKNPSEKKVK